MPSSPFSKPYSGGFIGREHHFALTIYFEDTDAFGIVYYANYLKFMERSRSDMLRAIGIDQALELERSGSAYAVVSVDIHYHRPARLGEEVQIVSVIDQLRASSVRIQQRVMRNAELLTDASVTAAFLDGNGRPRRQPREWVEKFNAIVSQIA